MDSGGEFSGYYCKIANVSDGKLLCIQNRSRDEDADAITFVDQGPERFVAPTDYDRFEPKQPLDFQQWLMIWMPNEKVYKVINRNSGLLLCVKDRSTDENHRLVQYRDQNLSFQWWQVTGTGDNFTLVNKNSGKVLAVRSDSAVQQTSDGSQQQQWTITSLLYSGYVGEFKIKNVKATSKLLCIESRSISDDAGAIIYDDQELNYQWWRLFVHGWDNGAFEIQNVQSGKLLCIKNRSTSNDGRAIQYYDQELSFQKWKLTQVSSDQMKIINVNSGRMLCVQNRSTGNSAAVIQYEDQNLSFQWWEFSKLSGDIDLNKLITFYNSPPKEVLSAADLGTDMCPELLLWYQNFIQTFGMEVLGLLGVLPTPSREDLATLSHLVLGDSSVRAQMELILGATFTVGTFTSLVALFWKYDLWSQIFQLLLKKVWSLPTLVRATAFVASLIAGAGTAATVIKVTKSVIILGLLIKEKPVC